MTGESSRLQRDLNPMPDDVQAALEESGLAGAYERRPPYQRNDYLGWIARARQPATRRRRLEQMLDELARGDVYMRMPWHGRAAGG